MRRRDVFTLGTERETDSEQETMKTESGQMIGVDNEEDVPNEKRRLITGWLTEWVALLFLLLLLLITVIIRRRRMLMESLIGLRPCKRLNYRKAIHASDPWNGGALWNRTRISRRDIDNHLLVLHLVWFLLCTQLSANLLATWKLKLSIRIVKWKLIFACKMVMEMGNRVEFINQLSSHHFKTVKIVLNGNCNESCSSSYHHLTH